MVEEAVSDTEDCLRERVASCSDLVEARMDENRKVIDTLVRERIKVAADWATRINGTSDDLLFDIRLRSYGFLVIVNKEVGKGLISKSRIVTWEQLEKKRDNPLITAMNKLLDWSHDAQRRS